MTPAERRAYVNEWYARNRERVSAQRNEWARNNPGKRAQTCRANNLKRKYGLTLDEWERLFDAQGRVCAICKTDTASRNGRWHTDHCHATNKVRSILCHDCNTGLGKFKDRPDMLRLAAEYLEKHAHREGT